MTIECIITLYSIIAFIGYLIFRANLPEGTKMNKKQHTFTGFLGGPAVWGIFFIVAFFQLSYMVILKIFNYLGD
jgi:hypothetical protein